MANLWLWFSEEGGYPLGRLRLGRSHAWNSRSFRSGLQLVLKFDNVSGRKAKPAGGNSPAPESNMPLPLESEMSLELGRVRSLLNSYGAWLNMNQHKPVLLRLACQTAEAIFEACPHLFRGDDIYLWEAMAWYWEGCGEVDKAARCLIVQASLQPGKTDAWLNLGAVYGKVKSWGQAVQAYLRGLRFDPEDRYIRSNLNQILADRQATAEALEYMDSLVANYPDPFNLLIAGDLLDMLGMHKEAAVRYLRGARKAGPGNRAGLRCLTGLTKIYLANEEYDKARPVVERTLADWDDDTICLEQAVELYSAEEELGKLNKYARQLVKKNPGSAAGHQALARCYLAAGDMVRAKEHAARARELQGR